MGKLIIRIHSDKLENAYPITAHLDDSIEVSNTAEFQNPFLDCELNELEMNADLIYDNKDQLRCFGERLFHALFNHSLRDTYESHFRTYNLPPSIHIWIEAPELWVLPWELLRDNDRNLNLALVTSITRSMRKPVLDITGFIDEERIKILYIVARPDDTDFLGLAEPKAILKALKSSELSNTIRVDLLRPPTYEKFIDQLKQDYHIIHFDGHGFWDTAMDQGALCFEFLPDKQGKRNTHEVTAEKLQNALMNSGVRLVILSACNSGQPNQFNAYSSVAHAIFNSGVPAVLAMRYSINADTACFFHSHLYRDLVAGKSVEDAVLQARKQVEGFSQDQDLEWFIPILYQQVSSIRIFNKAPSCVKPFSIPWTIPEPDIKIVGRDRELLDLDRALGLDDISTVTLTGMPGIGKTTLAMALTEWLKNGSAFSGGYFWHDFEVGGTIDTVKNEIGSAVMGNGWEQVALVDRSQHIQEYLTRKASLLVWDNFESILDKEARLRLLHFLRNLPNHSRALVMSRRINVGLTPLTKEKTVRLDVLSYSDAEELTWLHSDRAGVTDKLVTEKDRFPEFLETIGFHPLGISLAIPQLDICGWTLTELIRNLQRSIEALTLDSGLYDDPNIPERLRKVAASFRLTYDALSNNARSILPKLAIAFPGGMSNLVVPAILEISDVEWADITKELTIHNLLTIRSVIMDHLNTTEIVRSLHPLIRTFAGEKLENLDEWLLIVAGKYHEIAWRMLPELRSPHALVALTLFSIEEANLLYFLAYCEKNNHWDWGAHLIQALNEYYSVSGRWYEREQIILHGIDLSQRQLESTDSNVELKGMERFAIFIQNLGTLYGQLGRSEDSEGYYLQALEFARKINHEKGEAFCLQGLGSNALYRKDYDLAVEYVRQILLISKEPEYDELRAGAIALLAEIFLHQIRNFIECGEIIHIQRYCADALLLSQEALDIFYRLGDQEKQSALFGNLGTIAEITGEINNAEQYYQKSLWLGMQSGSRPGAALAHAWLATLYSRQKRYKESMFHYIQAMRIFRDLGGTPNRLISLNNIAELMKLIGQEQFLQLCDEISLDPTIGSAEIHIFVKEFVEFLEQSSGLD